ncbi:ABC transporter permease [Actinoallomurus iriomotensis]|uniref:ABC transporter permease n=1 Tax=Actinoallomurus iriomotensis TaxID=478107 RepID=A0A9W6S0A4_9ACTN|nr:ABC transporter permease [Actinoallomurus iriomotensis]GLY84764.1 ABC transporter permease [Actinoallomurus iriomotensis]
MTEVAEATAQTGSALEGGAASLWSDAWRDLCRRVTFWVSAVILLFMGVMAAFPSLFTGLGANDGCDVRQAKQRPASWNPFAGGDHPFGTDSHGCDYWAQVVHGTRAPIVVGFLVTAIALTLAIVLGSVSGYYGRLLDAFLSRITDIFFGLPLILGALVILTAFPSHGMMTESLVLGLLWWPTMTRLMRGQVLSVRDADYVQAARMIGASDGRIMLRHILPNAVAPVFVYAMLNVGVVIGYEATLDYLGVGLQYPTVSWGLQLSQAQEIFTDYPYLLIYPAVFLTATVLSFLLLGDAVRDALDPKLR